MCWSAAPSSAAPRRRRSFTPDFRNSVAAYAVSLLHPTIIRDLDLARQGLRIVERPLSNFLPLPDGRYLKASPGRTKAEVAKFSARDAERLDAYEARLERMADVLRVVALETPPNVATGRGLAPALRGWLDAARVANRLRPLGIEGQRDLVEIVARSAGDFLDQWFESDPIKAILGFDGIVGTYASPYAAGTAYVLLHHCFGETNGRKGVWGHAIGGMGAITQAMARSCAARGVNIRTGSAVAEILRQTAAPPASSPKRAKELRRAPSSPTSIRSSPSRSSSIPRRCRPTFAPASDRGAAPPACSA